ncbi:MAG: ROK family protein [Propionicimonas sp.]
MSPEKLPLLRLQEPSSQPSRGQGATASSIALLVASGAATSKAQLASTMDLSRTTVTGVVERLLRFGILRLHGQLPHAGRGRPAEALAISPDAGTVLIFDCGARSSRLAIVDASQQLLAEQWLDLNVDIGPAATFDILIPTMRELIAQAGLVSSRRCVVIGLPARVDYQAGVPVRPPIMPGWDGYRVLDPLRSEFDGPVLLENDANLRALGESRTLAADQSPLMAVKVGTGIGAGLITRDGRIHHGSAGASGEMGHIPLRSAPPTKCRCGRTGCLEAIASVPALIRRYEELAPAGTTVPRDALELAEIIHAGDTLATDLLREAAGHLGEAIATMVNVFNPARVAISGPTATVSDEFLAGVRSVVYEQARPLATRNFQVAYSVLGERGGITGAAVLGIEHLLSAESLSQTLYG